MATASWATVAVACWVEGTNHGEVPTRVARAKMVEEDIDAVAGPSSGLPSIVRVQSVAPFLHQTSQATTCASSAMRSTSGTVRTAHPRTVVRSNGSGILFRFMLALGWRALLSVEDDVSVSRGGRVKKEAWDVASHVPLI